MLKLRVNAFADPDGALPFNTSVVATIRTEDEEPKYSKLYPYPMGVADFYPDRRWSNSHRGTGRNPSYTAPALDCSAPATAPASLRPNSMVIDFRKLNSKTIADKYPMPNISMILANLGQAKYFTTLDLNEASATYTIETSDKPINCFRNQIVVEETRYRLTRKVILFREKTRHTSLFREIKIAVNPKVVNAIHCDLHTLAQIQDELVRTFPATKFKHC
ncbi:hypothetical protein KR018_012154, partial [Drosophila ironensis]